MSEDPQAFAMQGRAGSGYKGLQGKRNIVSLVTSIMLGRCD